MIDIVAILAAAVPAGLLLTGAAAGLGASFRLMRFPDLTIEGSFLTGASIWAAGCSVGWHTTFASMVGIASGAACGVLTAILSRIFGVDRFLAGILITTACYSLVLVVLGVSNRGLFGNPDAFFPGFDLGASPLAASVLFAMPLVMGMGLFFRLKIGVRARVAAINPRFLDEVAGHSLPYLAAGLAVTNAAAAASGIAFARFQGFVDVGMGQGVLIVTLASFAIGETFTRRLPINFTVQTLTAAALGSILYQLALGIALTVGVPAAYTKLVSALLVLLFLVAQSQRGAIEERPL